MHFPPADLQRAAHLANTNAVANTINGPIGLVAAPGAGYRIRLWGAHLASLSTRTGNLWIEIRDAGAGAYANLNAAPGASDDLWWAGGITLPPNSALQVRDSSNAATQSVRLFVYYTIERQA